MIVDARGHQCPTPTLRLARAMREAAPLTRITLLATDPMARIDAPHLAGQVGATVIGIETLDGVLRITVETPGVPTD
ncbi:SirA family protein [Rhizobium sp. CRIBSB]|nr:SirA family protein [Rhizobium sp. CRIBSB]